MITKEEMMEAIKQVVKEEIVREVVKRDMEIILGRENFGIDYLRAAVKKAVREELWEERFEIRAERDKAIEKGKDKDANERI